MENQNRLSPQQRLGVQLLLVVVLCLAKGGLWAGEPAPGLPAPQLAGRTVETARHRIVLGPAGLPAQIDIRAEAAELPLESRGKAPGAEVLRAQGRGEQLRAPLRFVVERDGQEAELVPAAPIALTLADGVVRGTGALSAGGVKATVGVEVDGAGALVVSLAYAAAEPLDRLALVMDLAGPLDTIVVGPPVGDAPAVQPAASFRLGSEEGLVWGNAAGEAKQGGRESPGLVEELFLGSGDRGFTVLCAPGEGWELDPAVSSMTLTRNQEGGLQFQLALVNHAVAVAEERSVRFALLTHPCRPGSPAARAAGWLRWPAGEPQGATRGFPALRQAAAAVRRADGAVLLEGRTVRSLLSGAAGGAGIDASKPLSDVVPLSLFRYLAGTHTGLTARLEPNAGALTRAGRSLGPDDMALGRALLHDIGLDVGGLAHLVRGATVVKALQRFGLFAADGGTEFLPYWRNNKVLRFGEAFSADDAFAVTQEDPLARVRCSAWRRPAPAGKAGTRALIVIVNEGDKAVRAQLTVLKPEALFGRRNVVTAEGIVDSWDTAFLPAETDWSKRGLMGAAVGDGKKGNHIVLHDWMDDGYVVQSAAQDGVEVYGPIHIPARSFRLLYGAGWR